MSFSDISLAISGWLSDKITGIARSFLDNTCLQASEFNLKIR